MHNIARIPRRFKRSLELSLYFSLVALITYIVFSQGIWIAVTNVAAGVLSNMAFAMKRLNLPNTPSDVEVLSNHDIQHLVKDALLRITNWLRGSPTCSKVLLDNLERLVHEGRHSALAALADEVSHFGTRRLGVSDDALRTTLNPLIDAAAQLSGSHDYEQTELDRMRHMLLSQTGRVIRELLKVDHANHGKASFAVTFTMIESLVNDRESDLQKIIEIQNELLHLRKRSCVSPRDREILKRLDGLLERIAGAEKN